jgi:hypothetical protein
LNRIYLAVVGIVLLAAIAGWTRIRPSHERTWIEEQRRLPYAESDGDIVTIRDVRNFRWGPGSEVVPAWETRTYDLGALESVWYVLTPFSRDWRGPAHTFVSFGFADGSYVGISVEARREEGEAYSILGGMLKRFEIMYVIADERDVIQLRANHRGDDVYVYPIRAERGQVRSMFLNMLARANGLHERPEFYGSLRNNCTSNLLAHVNEVATRRIAYGPRVLLPGYSDAIAHRLGLIATDLPLEQARSVFRINERSRRHADTDHYSLLIRGD